MARLEPSEDHRCNDHCHGSDIRDADVESFSTRSIRCSMYQQASNAGLPNRSFLAISPGTAEHYSSRIPTQGSDVRNLNYSLLQTWSAPATAQGAAAA